MLQLVCLLLSKREEEFRTVKRGINVIHGWPRLAKSSAFAYCVKGLNCDAKKVL